MMNIILSHVFHYTKDLVFLEIFYNVSDFASRVVLFFFPKNFIQVVISPIFQNLVYHIFILIIKIIIKFVIITFFNFPLMICNSKFFINKSIKQFLPNFILTKTSIISLIFVVFLGYFFTREIDFAVI